MNKPLHKVLIFSSAVLMALSVGAGTNNITVSANHHPRIHKGIHHHNHKSHYYKRGIYHHNYKNHYYKRGFKDGKEDIEMASGISDTMDNSLLRTLLHNHNNRQYINGVSAGLKYENRKYKNESINGNPFKNFKYDVNIIKFVYHQRGKIARKAARDCVNSSVAKRYRHNKTYRRAWNATNHQINKHYAGVNGTFDGDLDNN